MRKVWRGTQLGIERWRETDRKRQSVRKRQKKTRKRIRRRLVVIVFVVVLDEGEDRCKE